MKISRETRGSGGRSEAAQRLLRSTILAAALVASLGPAALGEGAGSDYAENDADLIWGFVLASDAVSANLAAIDRALLNASLALSSAGVEGSQAGEVLEDLTGLGPWVVDCITVDVDGVIVEVAPEEYQEVEGTSIGDQEHIEELISTRRPVGLAYIESVEGIRAMDFASPIFDEEGRFVGAVTVLVNSTELFGAILAPYQLEGAAKIWAMMPDGTIIYETDADQIGRNTFDDPLFQPFPEILEMAERVGMERSGRGTYEISGTEYELLWTTIDYQGREIRLLLSMSE